MYDGTAPYILESKWIIFLGIEYYLLDVAEEVGQCWILAVVNLIRQKSRKAGRDVVLEWKIVKRVDAVD